MESVACFRFVKMLMNFNPNWVNKHVQYKQFQIDYVVTPDPSSEETCISWDNEWCVHPIGL
jgi:hypothetical protein